MFSCSSIEGTRLRCDVGLPLFVARALGLPRYFSGYRCDRGHIAFRRTADKKCLECRKEMKRRLRLGKPRRQPRILTLTELRAEWRRKRSLWRERHPEAFQRYRKAKRQRHKARRRGATGTHTLSDLITIFKSQKGRCAYFRTCKTRLGDGYHVDHIMPICQGGTNDRPNIQLICPACNWSKNGRHPVDFAQSLGLLI